MQEDPAIWGPTFWNTFHTVAATYEPRPSKSTQRAMKQFVGLIPTLLPCTTCRDHAFAYIGAANLDYAVLSRESLFSFFVDFHNSVNARLGKRALSHEDARALYAPSSRKPLSPFGAPSLPLRGRRTREGSGRGPEVDPGRGQSPVFNEFAAIGLLVLMLMLMLV